MTRTGPGLVGSEASAARSQPRYKVGGLESLVHCRAGGGARKMPAPNRQPASSPSSFKQVFVYTQNQSYTSPHLFRDHPVQYFLPPLRRCPGLRSLSTSSLVRHRTRSAGGRCVYLSNVSVVSGEGQLDGEVVCLLIRKSLEQLAFSSLVAHKAVLRKRSRRLCQELARKATTRMHRSNSSRFLPKTCCVPNCRHRSCEASSRR
jgi:hypothetical protein